MPKVTRSFFINYGVAVVAVALALLLTQLLWPMIAPSAVPLFFAAVMAVSWYGGLGPGLLATGLSTLALAYYFTPLHYSAITSLEDITRPGIFTLVALLTSWLNSRRRRSVADLLAQLAESKRLEAESKRLEAESKHLVEESRREKDFSERLVDNSGDGFFVFNRDCQYILWNAGMERISGISRTDALGKSAFDLFPSLREMGEDSYFLDALHGKSAVSLDIPHIFPTGQDGFIDTHYWPLRDRSGEIIGGLALVYDSTERKRIEDERLRLFREDAARREVEAAERRSAFLAEVCSSLSSSTEYQATLAAVASLVVSEIADWCIVDIVETKGSFRRLSVAHRNPSRSSLSLEIERLFSLEPRSDSAALYGPLLSLNNGESEMVAEIAETWLAAVSRDASHLKNLQGLGLKSYISVPFQTRGQVLGAMTVARRDRYGRVELGMAEDIARHCALAIDNARLYEELQEANRFRDKFLGAVSQELLAPLPVSEPVIADCGLRIADYQPLNLEPVIGTPQSIQEEINNSFEVIVIDSETEPCGMQINHKETKETKI